jgi:glycosyl transferase, family 25
MIKLFFSLLFFSSLFCYDIQNIEFYLVHGPYPERRRYMQRQLIGFLPNYQLKVKWVGWPNYMEMTDKHYKMFSKNTLSKGVMSCCIKHYLIIKEIVEKQIPVAVIMEDNICFLNNVEDMVSLYLKQLPEDWDLLFDSDICGLHYNESKLVPGKVVYKKSNYGGEDSSRGCNFYMVTLEAAKKLLKNYLPIGQPPDFHYNDLFRKLNLNVYWAEPVNVHKIHWGVRANDLGRQN